MAERTTRKFLNLLSFCLSLLVVWLTGATSSANEPGEGLTDPVESSIWKLSRPRLSSSTSALLPFDPLGTGIFLDRFDGKPITVAAYGSESPSSQAGSGSAPIKPNSFVPANNVPTAQQERATLQRFLNLKARIQRDSDSCRKRIVRGRKVQECIADVLTVLETRLAREASRGSSVAKSALPIVRQMARDVRRSGSGKQSLAIVRSGIGKVQRIRLVRSQDTVIAKLQGQQRAVLAETLQAVEVNLAKAISL